MTWALVALAAMLAVYVLAVLVLMLSGRRTEARALARFVPDCAVLFQRLVRDPRVPRAHKVLLIAAVAYLAMPIDLVPDFIPVAGQLDDAILVVLALRVLLRSRGPALVREHWPGPENAMNVVLRLAYGTAG